MALLRPKELRAMRSEDIKAKFKELNDELMHERGIAAMGGAPSSPGKLRALRTSVARIHTVMRETELAEAKKKLAEKKRIQLKEKKEEDVKPTKEEKKEWQEFARSVDFRKSCACVSRLRRNNRR